MEKTLELPNVPINLVTPTSEDSRQLGPEQPLSPIAHGAPDVVNLVTPTDRVPSTMFESLTLQRQNTGRPPVTAPVTEPLHVPSRYTNPSSPRDTVRSSHRPPSSTAHEAHSSTGERDGAPRPAEPRVEECSGKATDVSTRSKSCSDCQREPVFDSESGLCQVCILLPRRCVLCELRCANVGDGFCENCTRQLAKSGGEFINVCPSCSRSTIFAEKDKQCSYCSADVLKHAKCPGTLTRKCSKCPCILGFARPSLKNNYFCWCCTDKLEERLRLHPIPRDEPKSLVQLSVKTPYRQPRKLPMGLWNLGVTDSVGTCYLNSVLQCLLQLPVFCNTFDTEHVLSLLKSKEPLNLKFFRHLDALHQCFQLRQTASRERLLDLKTALGRHCSVFLDDDQQDALECLTAILSALSTELTAALRLQCAPVRDLVDKIASTESESSQSTNVEPVDDDKQKLQRQLFDLLQTILPTGVFQSEIVQDLWCSVCHAKHTQVEQFHYLSLNLPVVTLGPNGPDQDISVQSLLENYFSKRSTVDFQCLANDCTGTSARQISKLQAPPKVLVCHLKRFNDIYLDQILPVSASKSNAASKTSHHETQPATAAMSDPFEFKGRDAASSEMKASANRKTPPGKLRGGANPADGDRDIDLQNPHISSPNQLLELENNDLEVDDEELLNMNPGPAARVLLERQSRQNSGCNSPNEASNQSPAPISRDTVTDQSRPNSRRNVDSRGASTSADIHVTGFKNHVRVQLTRQFDLLSSCAAQRLNLIPVPARSCSVMTAPRGLGGSPNRPELEESPPNKRPKPNNQQVARNDARALSTVPESQELNSQNSGADSDVVSTGDNYASLPNPPLVASPSDAPFGADTASLPVLRPRTMPSNIDDFDKSHVTADLTVVPMELVRNFIMHYQQYIGVRLIERGDESNQAARLADPSGPISIVLNHVEKVGNNWDQMVSGTDADLRALAIALQHFAALEGATDGATNATAFRNTRVAREEEQEQPPKAVHSILSEEEIRQIALDCNIDSVRLAEIGCASYTLHAVVHHNGHSALRGHYTATVRESDNQMRGQGKSQVAKWHECSDYKVRVQSEAEALDGTAQETAYILVYVRNDVLGVVATPHRSKKSTNASHSSSNPAPASVCIYKGLQNQQSTCYLNALLQSLFMTPEFRNAIYRFRYTEEHDGALDDSLVFQLQRLFLQLQSHSDAQTSFFDTVALTKSFGWTQADARVQHDVHEMYTSLLSALDVEFADTDLSGLIAQLYSGDMVQCVTCSVCDAKNTKEETFQHIVLEVRGENGWLNLHSSLQLYLKTADLKIRDKDIDDRYLCLNCDNTKQNATKSLTLERLPHLLTFQLARFSFNPETEQRFKINSEFGFPTEIDFNDDQYRGLPIETKWKYELFAVLMHQGAAGGGHYYAYIKTLAISSQPTADERAALGTWFEFDDTRCESLTEADMLRHAYGSESASASAYMLFYRKVETNPADNVTLIDDTEDLKRYVDALNESVRANDENPDSLLRLRVRYRNKVRVLVGVHKQSTIEQLTRAALDTFELDQNKWDTGEFEYRISAFDEFHQSVLNSFEMRSKLVSSKIFHNMELLLQRRGAGEEYINPVLTRATLRSINATNVRPENNQSAVQTREIQVYVRTRLQRQI